MVLGQAIRDGALPKLEVLNVEDNGCWKDDEMMPVIEGLGAGGCPNLKELGMKAIPSQGVMDGAGSKSGMALAHALTSLALTKLNVGWNDAMGDKTMADIIMSLASGPSRDTLESLSIINTGMCEEAGKAVVQGAPDALVAEVIKHSCRA